MKKINLMKYGFYRTPEQDFSDDGSRFICYGLEGADRIRLSKTKWQDEIFLSATIYGELEGDEYSKLTHFKGLDRLNGVEMNDLTEADLEQLTQDCIEYQKEYEEAEKRLTYPTVDEIKTHLTQNKELREHEYQVAEQMIKDSLNLIISGSKYQIGAIFDCAKALKNNSNINIEKETNRIFNTRESRQLIKNNSWKNPSWNYTYLLKLINEIKNN